MIDRYIFSALNTMELSVSGRGANLSNVSLVKYTMQPAATSNQIKSTTSATW